MAQCLAGLAPALATATATAATTATTATTAMLPAEEAALESVRVGAMHLAGALVNLHQSLAGGSSGTNPELNVSHGGDLQQQQQESAAAAVATVDAVLPCLLQQLDAATVLPIMGEE